MAGRGALVKMSSRSGALLDEFEAAGLLLRGVAVVRATCDEYARRFRALVRDEWAL